MAVRTPSLELLLDVKLDPQSGQLYRLQLTPYEVAVTTTTEGPAAQSSEEASTSAASEAPESGLSAGPGRVCQLCCDEADDSAPRFSTEHAVRHARMHSDLGRTPEADTFRQCFPDLAPRRLRPDPATPIAAPAPADVTVLLDPDEEHPPPAKRPRTDEPKAPAAPEPPEDSAESEAEELEAPAAEDAATESSGDEGAEEGEEGSADEATKDEDEPELSDNSDTEEESPVSLSAPPEAKANKTLLNLNLTIAGPSIYSAPTETKPIPQLNQTVAGPSGPIGPEKSDRVYAKLNQIQSRLYKRFRDGKTYGCRAAGCWLAGDWAAKPTLRELEEHVHGHLSPQEQGQVAACVECKRSLPSVSKTTCCERPVVDLRGRLEERYLELLDQVVPEISRAERAAASPKVGRSAAWPGLAESSLDAYLRQVAAAVRASGETLTCRVSDAKRCCKDPEKLLLHLCSDIHLGLKLWECRECGFDASRRYLAKHTKEVHQRELPSRDVEAEWRSLRPQHEAQLLAQAQLCFPPDLLEQWRPKTP